MRPALLSGALPLMVLPLAALQMLALLSLPAAAADIPITQQNGQFSQTTEVLSKGDTLTLMNKDTGPHDVSLIDEDGDPTDLGVQQPGVSVTVKFDDAGDFKLRCSIAPTMRMNVTVK